MRFVRLGLGAFAAVLGLAPAAFAQELPPTTPTRDVAVTYESKDPTNAGRVFWLAAEGRARIESRAQRGVALVDLRGNRVVVVLEDERSFHDMGRIAPIVAASMHVHQPRDWFTREGQDRVAGQPCTVWRIQSPLPDAEGGVMRACITADGVWLRLVEGEGAEAETLYTAAAVTYGVQDPARFRVPEGYRPMDFSPRTPRR